MAKSCQLANQLTDSFYQEKLNNLAESYKRLNLDFNDIQEDEFESDQAATNSYNIARSVIENIELGDSNEGKNNSPYTS